MGAYPETLRMAVASLNQTVGDWAGNRARIVDACARARARGVMVLALPELSISGYSLADRVLMRDCVRQCWQSLTQILPHTRGLVLTVGLPIEHEGILLDAVAVIVDSVIVGLVAKENLATGDVQYESRWYTPWPHGVQATFTTPDGDSVPLGSYVFDIDGVGKLGVEICEDAWLGERPAHGLALAGADLIINASASWFAVGKHATRRRIVREHSREDHCAYLYASLMGCDATRLVFDGSAFIAADGCLLAEGPRFQMNDDVVLTEACVDTSALWRARRVTASWRAQQIRAMQGVYGGPAPHLIVASGLSPSTMSQITPTLPDHALDASLQWLIDRGLLKGPIQPTELAWIELELALVMGIRDYLRKTGVQRVALALSGGRDSAMCAVLISRLIAYTHETCSPSEQRAKVKDILLTAYLPTENSGDLTRQAAAALADAIGSHHLVIPLEQAVKTHRQLAETALGRSLDWAHPVDDLVLQNLQARSRASMIWTLANAQQRLLLTTSNMSEAAVGYATMDGDTAGGLAPLGGVPKTYISAWLAWACNRHDLSALQHVLAQPATAELRPADRAQTDEHDLMPYDVLDTLMMRFVRDGQSPLQMLQTTWPHLRSHCEDQPKRLAAYIRRFTTMCCRAQWKRERLAIAFRVLDYDLDPKGGFRFAAVQAPFTEELAQMDAYASTMTVD